MPALNCGCQSRVVDAVGHGECPITWAARETGVWNPSDFPNGLPPEPEPRGDEGDR